MVSKKPPKKAKRAKPKKRVSVKSKKPSFLEGPLRKTKIRIIGIGGGGGSIVSELASRLEKVSFVIANTDLRALRKSTRKAKHFSFGQEATQGLGTGMNPELGRIAAENEQDRIKKLLKGQDLCILVSSLGGGTGSGAAPVFAKISKKLGNLTYGIFTLPFKFEGEKKMEIAKNSLAKLRPNLDAFTIIPNERIFRIIDKKTPLKEALSQINKKLTQTLEGLIETLYLPGLINIDFADFRAILQGQGKLTYLNTIEVQGPNRIEQAIKKIISTPFYPYNVRGAKGILFNIAGENDINLAEVSEISKSIFESVNKGAKIIFGLSQRKKGKNKIKITLLATGCKTKIFSKPKKKLAVTISKNIQKRLVQEPSFRTRKRGERRERSSLRPPKKRRFLPQKKKPALKEKKEDMSLPPKEPPELKVKVKTKLKKTKPATKRLKEKRKKESKPKKPAKPEKPKVKKVKKELPPSFQELSKVKIDIKRKNALQIKKEAEKQEQDMLKQEKEWEIPAFFRKKTAKNEQ